MTETNRERFDRLFALADAAVASLPDDRACLLTVTISREARLHVRHAYLLERFAGRDADVSEGIGCDHYSITDENGVEWVSVDDNPARSRVAVTL